jgi:type I restriction enzyme S subunit
VKKDWQLEKLGDVIKLEYGKPLQKKDRLQGGKYPAYGANGIKCWTNEYYFDKKSLIVGRKGSAGEVNYTTERFWPLDVTYFVTYDNTKYDLDFLYHCLKFLQLPKLAKGVKPGINRNDVYRIIFSFPSLSEQKRIVAILDEVFAGIDDAIANTEKNLTNTRELFESHLSSIFSETGKNCLKIKLSDITERITKGSSPKWQGISYVEEPGVLFVTSENVGQNTMLFQKTKYVEEAFNKKDVKSILFRGDVLTNIVGASIGRTAIYDRDEQANINQAVCLIRCLPDKLSNKYLTYLLNSPYFRYILHQNEINNARANLSLGFFRNLPVPLPSLNAQKNIVSRMDEISDKTQYLETIYQQKLTALNELKQSILQKAFTGELTADTASQATRAKEEIAA